MPTRRSFLSCLAALLPAWLVAKPDATKFTAANAVNIGPDFLELAAEHDRLEDQKKWIPVTERLPETPHARKVGVTFPSIVGLTQGDQSAIVRQIYDRRNETLNVLDSDPILVSDGSHVRTSWLRKSTDGTRFFFDGCGGVFFVTHWRPLPAPPELLRRFTMSDPVWTPKGDA